MWLHIFYYKGSIIVFIEYINYNFINYSHTAAFSLISHNNNYYSNNILSHMVTFFFKIISVWDTSLRVCENADTQDSTFFMALTIFIPNCFPIGNNNLYCHQLCVFVNKIGTKLYLTKVHRCMG